MTDTSRTLIIRMAVKGPSDIVDNVCRSMEAIVRSIPPTFTTSPAYEKGARVEVTVDDEHTAPGRRPKKWWKKKVKAA